MKKYRGKRDRRKTRKMDFSKKVLVWVIILTSVGFTSSFILAFFDKNPVTEITTTLLASCVGSIVAYSVKSAFEKNSRNKYHLDADGLPFEINNNEEGNNYNG